MPFKKGDPKPPSSGRKKGQQNHSTKAVREALLLCYDKIGGDSNFAVWALQNQTEFYKLWVKIMPTEVNASGEMLMRFAPQFGREDENG